MAAPRLGRSPLMIAAFAALLLCAGCTVLTPSGDEPGTAPSSPESAASDTPDGPAEVASECVDGEWSADLDDLIGQLADQLSSTGLTVTRTDASGSQTLAVGREGVLGFDADMTLTLAVDMGNGMVMTMTQVHTGTLQANWAWEGDTTATGGTIGFSDFENSGYEVQTTVDINGQAAEAPIEPPSVAAADVPTAVTCEGDTLTTQPVGSPFTTTWTRSG